MIEVIDLTKKYGDHVAVNHLSFTIEPGRIYGFLGPNGAGKSTTMNMITGCLAPTCGRVLIDGHDIYDDAVAAKKSVGYLPEIPPVYPDMTPYEYLRFVAEAKGIKASQISEEVVKVMEETDIFEKRNRLIKNLSKGFKQRVGIAQAMLGDPSLIILDEPTVGLDPHQIIEIRDLIARLGKNRTIILSSHILSEVQAVCDYVMIINNGNLVASDTLENIRIENTPDNKYALTVRSNPDAIEKILSDMKDVLSFEIDGTDENNVYDVTVEAEKNQEIGEALFHGFASAGYSISRISKIEPSLEEIFISLTENFDGEVIPNVDPLPEEYENEELPEPAKEEYTPMFGRKEDGE